jgi:protein-tyrosine-phosphatase
MANQADRETLGPIAPAATRRLCAKRVLLVCTGNTCRSPMAAALLRDAANKDLDFFASGIEIKSAGTDARAGDSATSLAIKVMKHRRIDLNSHRATRLTPDVIDWADLILTMKRSHKDRIVGAYPAAAGKVSTMAEYAGEEADIEDPLPKGTEEAYEHCVQDLARLMPRVLQRVKSAKADSRPRDSSTGGRLA